MNEEGRALVLGGGGVTGIAWELGMIAGLCELDVDLTGADTIVGTSAGSVVGAQVATGVNMRERYAAQLEPPDGEVPASLGRMTMLRFGLAMLCSRSPERIRARIGALAQRASTVPEKDRIDVIGARLPVHQWPDRALRITAVDAQSGAFRVFDRESGVPLVTAVAASCAVPGVWPPVTVDGRRYIDGGIRSAVNADLARGHGRVVVLAPLTRGFGPIAGAGKQIVELRATGSRVVLVSPDEAAVAAIGPNVLDPEHRAGAAMAGRRQASAVAAEIAEIW